MQRIVIKELKRVYDLEIPMKTWKILGYMGLIPFVACLYLSEREMVWGIAPKSAFIAYSAIILSFIAGTIWRVDRQLQQSHQQIVSNIFSITAFACLLIHHDIALGILAASYLLLFLYEIRFVKQSKLKVDYISMRFRLTLAVILLHIVALILWS